MEIDLTADLARRYRVLLGEFERIEILLVGCGGTGSFLALHLARLAYHARAAGLTIDLLFIDPDTVEEPNIGRQNFCPAEIGEHKAATLARRFSLAYGLPIRFMPATFDRDLLPCQLDGSVRVIAGCVDNAAARREIAAWRAGHYRDNRVWWLDGGNHRDGGQVHIGNGDEVVISPFGFCSQLPAPDVQAPDLVVDPESGPAALADLSCAELAALDAQSLMVNQAIAGWLATYLYRLLITRDLDIMATYVDLVTGSVRSEPITDPADEEE